MATVPVNRADLVDAARDSFYVTVGLGVIAFQRAQVRRRELTRQLGEIGGSARSHLDGAGRLVEGNVKLVEERVQAAEERLDAVLDDVQERLPEPTRSSIEQARSATREARRHLRSFVSGLR